MPQTSLQHRTSRLREESKRRDPEGARVRAEGSDAESVGTNPYPAGSWQWFCWQKGRSDRLRWQP